ncbi:MAG: flagellar motor protein MotB [Oscillospiraceae bacterium]|nr:flagellar motor protein MotB [Oscillospiraceae bacterium]
MKKKKGGGGGGANWMDTYGDMVTLLLCFFVLLYSMSTVSEDKWRAIVQSFNPNSIRETTQIDGGNQGPHADPWDQFGSLTDPEKAMDEASMEAVDAALQALYDALSEYVEQNDLGQSIEVTKGDGYIFISFSDAVFFAGDSYTLLDSGKEVLDVVAAAMNGAAPYIDEVRIMGHTAQAWSDRANNPTTDRFLASNRATVTTVYLQERVDISPARLVSVGYGQWRPVSSNVDDEHRAHNRRVELMITGLDLLNQMGDSIQQYKSFRSGEGTVRTTPADSAAAQEAPAGDEADMTTASQEPAAPEDGT